METTVAILGGGISGLSCAYELSLQGVDFRVLERSDRLGGTIRTERHGDLLIDPGPDAFLTQKPAALALCRELGLESRLLPTNPLHRNVYVFFRGRLHPLPEGMVLTVPTRILPFLRTSLFSVPGKLRMALEPFVPVRRSDEEESIASFIQRRLGREALTRLAEPLLAGIHSGEPESLSMTELFPRFPMMEKKYGSLWRGMRKAMARRPATGATPPPSPFVSLTNGLEELVQALVGRLPRDAPLTGVTAVHLSRPPHRYAIELSNGEKVFAEGLVLALPLRESERLGFELSTELGDSLARIPTVSTAVVFLAVPRDRVDHPLDGYGFVVPRTEGRRLLAGTFVSTKFPNRAPKDTALFRIFLGGRRDPGVMERDDPELARLAAAELSAVVGAIGEPVFSRVYRWIQKTPQVELSHRSRVARIDRALADLPRLRVIGNGLRGVGIPDCIADARSVARELAGVLASEKTTS